MITEEQKRNAVFTVQQVTKEHLPVLLVVHDREDEWQFLPNVEVTEADIVITALENVIKIDSSLEKILWIPGGTQALRDEKDGEWTTSVYAEE